MATDEQLIHQIKQGENEAFRQLFHKYQKQIYFICLNIVKNPHDTEEIVQDTFVHAYLKIDQLKKPDKFSTWLKRIARNCSINYVNRKQEESIPLVAATAQISTQTIPDRLLLRRELIDAVMEAIESLPQEDREMIRARIDGLSHSEISEKFGISISASTTRLYRVRKRLKACIKDLLNAIVWLPIGYNEGMHSYAGRHYDDPTLTGQNRWTPGGHAASHREDTEKAAAHSVADAEFTSMIAGINVNFKHAGVISIRSDNIFNAGKLRQAGMNGVSRE